MNIIGLTGPAGSGKDTVARFLCETQGFVQVAFADAMRDGLKAMFGLTDRDLLDRARKELVIPWMGVSPRKLMQELGMWARNTIDRDVWVTITAGRVDTIVRAAPASLHISGIVVSDVRFANEAGWLRETGAQLWHIHRTTRAYTGLASNARLHCSEAGIEWKTGDRCIHNDGSIDDLYEHLGEIFTLEETSCQTQTIS